MARQKLLLFLAGLAVVFGITAGTAAQDQENGDPQTDAVALFNRGQDEHASGHLAEAVAFYERALKLLPEFPEAEYQRGTALVSLGDRKRAEAAYRRAVELRPDWSLALASLGAFLVEERRFADAGPFLEKAIELDAQSFPALAALVELRLKTNASKAQLNELLLRIRPMTDKASPTGAIWAARGALEFAAGDLAAASISTRKALEIDPSNVTALVHSGELALLRHDPEAARAAAVRLEHVPAAGASAILLKAKVLELEGRTQAALDILATVKEPSPELAALRGRLGAKGQAASELEKMLASDPSNVAALGQLCSVLRAEDPPKALDYCKRASAAEPDNPSHVIGYAAALVQAKRYADAAVLLNKLLELEPANSTVHANLATALFQLKRYAEARNHFDWLIERKIGLPVAYFMVAICHDQLGEYLDAAANYHLFLAAADPEKNRLEIEKVNLRMPFIDKQLAKRGKR
jgi:tetratricopeptide (TPR) repeat protein